MIESTIDYVDSYISLRRGSTAFFFCSAIDSRNFCNAQYFSSRIFHLSSLGLDSSAASPSPPSSIWAPTSSHHSCPSSRSGQWCECCRFWACWVCLSVLPLPLVVITLPLFPYLAVSQLSRLPVLGLFPVLLVLRLAPSPKAWPTERVD